MQCSTCAVTPSRRRKRCRRSPRRVCGCWRSPAAPSTGEVPVSAETAERDLELYGLLALEDPPRADVREAIASCRRAGIKVAMITGDHPATAAAIATETGLRHADDPVLLRP